MKTKHKYSSLANTVRKHILDISYKASVGHVGSAYSIVEILVALYFDIMRIDPKKPKWESRDRFILSKGHASPALYAVLYLRGFLSKKILESYCQNDGLLEEHPKHHLPGIEISTGSLGHGLPVAAGMALAAQIRKLSFHTFTLLSDAECDEGETWEAALFAGHYALSNLTVFLDYNKVQALGKTTDVMNLEPLHKKWAAFGWDCIETDGHDTEKIIHAYRTHARRKKPLCIICHTIRGKGVSFMEHVTQWHYKNPTRSDVEEAIKELRTSH